jgi:hypothetical protein
LLVVFVLVGGASGLGVLVGRILRRHLDLPRAVRRPAGGVLGVVGLILAFGLTLAGNELVRPPALDRTRWFVPA